MFYFLKADVVRRMAAIAASGIHPWPSKVAFRVGTKDEAVRFLPTGQMQVGQITIVDETEVFVPDKHAVYVME